MELLEYTNRWNSQRLGSLFREQKKKNTHFARRNALKFTYGSIVDKPEYDMTPSLIDTYSKYTLVDEGDIVINCLNLNYDFVSQRVAIVKNSGIITSAYISLRARNADINPLYYCYYFKAMDARKMFHGMGTGIRLTLSYNELRNVPIPVPPRAEQDQIVRFLDWKVSEINKLIGIRRKEIQELEELKASSMRTVFSEGLSSDTKINSNEIDWLGSFPQRWKVMRLKSVLQSYFGGTWGEEPVGDKNDLLCIRVADFDFDNLTVKPTANTYRHYSKSLISERSLQDGDIILEKSGGGDKTPVGRVICYHSFGDSKVMFANFSECLRPDKGQVLPVFLATELKVFYQSGYIRNYYNQTTGIQNVTVPQYLSMPIVVPPKPEQEIIVQYLNSACSKIDSLIESTHKKIAELTEMKSVIISEVVTGKIDVRNITVPQYEHVDDIYDDNNEDGEETDESEIYGEED
jgi:type I restriction enzyme S subunit